MGSRRDGGIGRRNGHALGSLNDGRVFIGVGGCGGCSAGVGSSVMAKLDDVSTGGRPTWRFRYNLQAWPLLALSKPTLGLVLPTAEYFVQVLGSSAGGNAFHRHRRDQVKMRLAAGTPLPTPSVVFATPNGEITRNWWWCRSD